MPYSFTQIEEDKTRTIVLVFGFLIVFYFLAFLIIATIIGNIIDYNNLPYYQREQFQFGFLDWSTTLFIFAVAFAVGYGHWQYTNYNLINKMLGVLGAEKLNETDTYHQMFRNILDEVSVATGGTKIEGVVIPTVAMNAFALSDFSGRNVIGVTEGVLARLNRAQIEAIVGHEAAHVVTKDCLSTTVTSSLFELYSGMLKGMELLLRGSARSSRYSRGRGGGGGILIILVIYMVLFITKSLSHLVRMFISRQREFRADAVAVRLTRDPLSLAEALYAIAYHWRGQGLSAEEMEAIFIINPKYSYLDEGEGFFSELFSTHPPVEKRLGILLDMAHSDVEMVVENVKRLDNKPRTKAPSPAGTESKWMVQKDGQWHGPFELVQMATFDWIRPDTLIRRFGVGHAMRAFEDRHLAEIVSQADAKGDVRDQCPRCKLPLSTVSYEGAELKKCPFCRGVLVQERDVMRIIIREEVGFDERIKRIAAQLKKESDIFGKMRINRDPKTLFTCPTCNHPRQKMHRMFYTEVYKVEIDKCFACGSVWFDQDELEVLQCLIEQATSKSSP